MTYFESQKGEAALMLRRKLKEETAALAQTGKDDKLTINRMASNMALVNYIEIVYEIPKDY